MIAYFIVALLVFMLCILILFLFVKKQVGVLNIVDYIQIIILSIFYAIMWPVFLCLMFLVSVFILLFRFSDD